MEGQSGGLDIHQTIGGDYRLTVGDNGIGKPEFIDFENTDSLGLSLVRMPGSDQLGGIVQIRRGTGTEFLIRFTDEG